MHAVEVSTVAPLIPERDPRDLKLASTSINIPEWLRDRIGELAEAKGYSRSDLITRLLKFSVAHLEAAETDAGPDEYEALTQAEEWIAKAKKAYESGLKKVKK